MMRIVVAVDGSPVSARVARHVVALAKSMRKAPAIVLLVVDLPMMPGVERNQHLSHPVDREPARIIEGLARNTHSAHPREIDEIERDDLTGRLHDPERYIRARGRRGCLTGEQNCHKKKGNHS